VSDILLGQLSIDILPIKETNIYFKKLFVKEKNAKIKFMWNLIDKAVQYASINAINNCLIFKTIRLNKLCI
jgi:hypothetical protein